MTSAIQMQKGCRQTRPLKPCEGKQITECSYARKAPFSNLQIANISMFYTRNNPCNLNFPRFGWALFMWSKTRSLTTTILFQYRAQNYRVSHFQAPQTHHKQLCFHDHLSHRTRDSCLGRRLFQNPLTGVDNCHLLEDNTCYTLLQNVNCLSNALTCHVEGR